MQEKRYLSKPYDLASVTACNGGRKFPVVCIEAESRVSMSFSLDKIMFWGASNQTAWELMQVLESDDQLCLSPICTVGKAPHL